MLFRVSQSLNRPVVVQHDTVGGLVVAEADVVIELSQFFTQDHQLVLSCNESCLVLTGCQQSSLQVRLHAGNLSQGVRRSSSHNWSIPDSNTGMGKLQPTELEEIIVIVSQSLEDVFYQLF